MVEPWVYPIALGAGGMGLLGLKHYNGRKEAKLNMIPKGGFELSSNGLHLPESASRGRLTIVAVGTGGLGMASRTIDEFAKASRLSDIGCVIAAEFDEREKNKFLKKIATNYPELYLRTVFNEHTSLIGGFQSRSWDEVVSKDIKPYWYPQLLKCLEQGSKLIRSTERQVYQSLSIEQQGYIPAIILIFASPGSHAPLANFCGQALHREFPVASIYLTTFIPENSYQERQFPTIINHYKQSNFAKAFFVGDMKRAGMFFDHAIATFFSAIWTAPLVADRPDEPWNVLARLSPGAMNEVVVPRVWLRNLPLKKTAGKSPRYFTFEESAVNAVIDGVKEIEFELAKTIMLSTPKDGTARYVSVTLPVRADLLSEVKDKVEEMLKARDYFKEDSDRCLVFSPTSELVGAQIDQVKMTVVKMEVAKHGVSGICNYITGQLPAGRRSGQK